MNQDSADTSTETSTQMALSESMASANIIALIDECLLILSQKRRTLEEKAISSYFHRLVGVYAALISRLNKDMSANDTAADSGVAALHRLRTVNENVRNCVAKLLKILKYDFNYLEQYFEYDYCAQLLNNQELLPALEDIYTELQQIDAAKAE